MSYFSFYKNLHMKDDLELQQDVVSQLGWDPFLHASDIEVSVKNGMVSLAGQVNSYAQKEAVEAAVRKVIGVRGISGELSVGASPAYNRSDDEIKSSVLHAFHWHSAIPEENIQVNVEDGVVTLEGEVEWDYQRTAAQQAVAGMMGVRDVINRITVHARATAVDVRSKISAAFHRSATIDAARIAVEVEGTKAILRGRVRSFAEKEDAAAAAWSAPGIDAVDNYLELTPDLEYNF